MIRVSPSILAADFANLEREIDTIKQAGAEYVHIDVMDGLFVPNISIGLPVLSCIRKVTDLTLDVHLMIDRPVRYAERFCQAGADIVTVHVEADTQENTLEALRIRIGMNGDGTAPLLRKCEDRTIIVGVECQPGIVRVKLDAVQRMIVNGAAERVDRFGLGIPDVDIRKGIKSAGIPPLHLGQISVHRVDGELHRHQKRIVKGHDNRSFDAVFAHDLRILMQVCKSPHIVRIWIGGMYRVRQNMNMGVDLFQRLPVCNSRSNPSRVPMCRFSGFFG